MDNLQIGTGGDAAEIDRSGEAGEDGAGLIASGRMDPVASAMASARDQGHRGDQGQRAQQVHQPGFQARLMEARDREAVRSILTQHHARTVFRDREFSNSTVDAMFDRVIARAPGMVGIIAEHDGAPVGIAWATADDYLLSDGPPFVTVHLVAVDLGLRPFRRAKAFLTLVAAVRQWAASEQASPVFFHVMTGTRLASTDRLMKAAGAQCVGGSYVV